MERGKELARRMRRVAPFQLGTDNEELVQFNVKPIRKRGSRKKAPENPLPPVPAPEATAANLAE